MICTNCGTQLPSNYENCTYCPYCGVHFQQTEVKPQTGKTNSKALAGLIVACVGLFVNFLGVTPVIALVLSVQGLKEIKQTGEDGREMAIAGIILASIDLLIVLVMIGFFLLFGGLVHSMTWTQA